MKLSPRSLPLVALVLLGAAACRSQPEPAPEPEPAPPPPVVATVDSAAIRDSIARAERERAEAAAREAALAEARRALEAVVYFDFDQSALTEQAQAILEAKVPVLQRNADIQIRIEGNTDERGSDEYNMALGQRRASAVKTYLVNRGIAAERMETVSYGEERPAAEGSSEEAWAQNRRAVFTVTAGQVAVTQD
ncbi:MAG TPA: peptidoglycan-associated lipoprotein Pal [Gemmatimonadaceae bacterium]|nr:peptidoglycan-associated lipoprotein Pal [Gemmatimonadaceae bacterium]